MSDMTSKRLLQGIVSLLGLVPVTVGLSGVIFGPGFLQNTPPPWSFSADWRGSRRCSPSRGHLAGLGLELVVVPLLALWQSRVAAQASLAQSK